MPYLLKWYTIIFATLALYYIHRKIRIARYYKKFGLKDVPNANTGRFFGLEQLKTMLTALKNGEVLEFFTNEILGYDYRTFGYSIVGVPLVMTVDPENVKALLATQFNDFALGSRHAHFKPLLGDGIFTLDGQGWKTSRAMLRPQFSREQIAHVRTLEPHVQTLAQHIRKSKGGVFDLQDLFFKFTVDTATDVLFGESVYCLRDGTVEDVAPVDGFLGREHFNAAFNLTQKFLARRSYSQIFYMFNDSFKFRRACKTVHGFAQYFVDRALALDADELEKKSQSGYTFLYELVKQNRDPKVLRDQLLNIMVAGRDTTAGLLSFAFFELSRNPEILAKLRAEVLENFGEGSEEDVKNITFESLKKSEYLRWVLNETLRMYPAVPMNFRDATKDTTLPVGGGEDGTAPIFVGKGTTVVYMTYVTQRLKEFYGEDANEFKPERWASNQKLGWAYLPFNGGPRICLGQQFALTEAAYVVVRLLQMFPDIQTAYDGQYPPKKMLHLTLSMWDGVPVTMS